MCKQLYVLIAYEGGCYKLRRLYKSRHRVADSATTLLTPLQARQFSIRSGEYSPLKMVPPRVSKMFLPSVAVFIILSGSTVAGLDCYWCGPLANQVHRSRRPTPCTDEAQRAPCDPGYTHCANIYSSPPHRESRVCTKVYQDECYTEFCNVTRTWKITCACEGDLCNERDLERETEIFNILSRLVDKSYKTFRFSKRSIGSVTVLKSKFISKGMRAAQYGDPSVDITTTPDQQSTSPVPATEEQAHITSDTSSTNAAISTTDSLSQQTKTINATDDDGPKSMEREQIENGNEKENEASQWQSEQGYRLPDDEAPKETELINGKYISTEPPTSETKAMANSTKQMNSTELTATPSKSPGPTQYILFSTTQTKNDAIVNYSHVSFTVMWIVAYAFN